VTHALVEKSRDDEVVAGDLAAHLRTVSMTRRDSQPTNASLREDTFEDLGALLELGGEALATPLLARLVVFGGDGGVRKRDEDLGTTSNRLSMLPIC
jgi:hypothetical protein